MNQPPESPYPPQAPAQSQPPRQNVIQIPRIRPVVTYTIIIVTAIVFLLQLASEYVLGIDLPFVFGGKINQFISNGEVWRFITPVLLHSTDIPYLHILFNMYALYNIGRSLEEEYGHVRFLILYLLGGFAGNVASFIMTPNPSLGASTAIFGLLGAEAVMVYQNRRFLGKNFRPILLNIVVIAAINLFFGFSTSAAHVVDPNSTIPQVDNWGHLGGLIGGSLFAWFAGPLWDIEGLAPNYKLVDRRSLNAVVTSGFLVAALTAAVAVFTITTRGR
jgi:rhomboid protease GluP